MSAKSGKARKAFAAARRELKQTAEHGCGLLRSLWRRQMTAQRARERRSAMQPAHRLWPGPDRRQGHNSSRDKVRGSRRYGAPAPNGRDPSIAETRQIPLPRQPDRREPATGSATRPHRPPPGRQGCAYGDAGSSAMNLGRFPPRWNGTEPGRRREEPGRLHLFRGLAIWRRKSILESGQRWSPIGTQPARST
jgi:hypothetical protein